MDLQKTSNCCSSNSKQLLKEKKKGILTFLSTLLIILIPKCPICIAAYSGAILLFFDIQNVSIIPFFTHMKPILGCIIIALILFNYNTDKSKVAITIAICALVLLILATYGNFNLLPNWIVYSGFLFAVWYNGNFKYFYNYIKTNNLLKV